MFIFLNILSIQGLQSFTECSSDQYYNSATLLCTSCPTNTLRYNNSLCVCNNEQGYQRIQNDIIGFQYGKLCEKQTEVCKSGQLNLKYGYQGSSLSQVSCSNCDANAYPNEYREMCIPCPDKQMKYTGSCECPDGYTKSYDRCIINSQKVINTLVFDNSNIIQYDTDASMSSSVISSRYIYAIATCYYSANINSCQMLANLCVLQLYDLTKPICSIFLKELATKIPATAPNLFPSVNIETINVYQTAFPQTMKLDDSDSKNRRYLQYTIKKFDLNGKLISNTALRSELILCPHSPNDEINSRAFGLNMKISCSLDLDAFLKNYEMYFYELQVTAVRDDSTIVPQDMYILVSNVKDQDGTYPNTDQATQSSMFVKRFFIVDTITGKKDYTSDTEIPQYIRYASKIRITILPSQDSYEQIYVPYVYIEYSTMRNSGDQFGNADFEFDVQISPNPTNYWVTIIILFVIYNVIIFLVWLFRIYVWTKANPKISIRNNYTWQLIKNTIRLINDSWTDWMFYFLFLMTAYWFVFFKFQNTPFLLMLDQNDQSNYRPFYGLFYTLFALRIVHTFGIIYFQSSINIYFIDWEKTEIYRPVEKRKQEELEENEMLLTANKIKSRVSIWRTLLVANEFNELSSVRTVSVEWTLIILGFVLIGLGFQKRFIESPDLIETQPNVPENPILKYFLVQFVYLIIGLGQLILRRILNIWEPYPYENFVDLCSIANVSIFILDDNLHGYYIHGENPLGFSEGGLAHLQECLRNESKNKGKNRGLIKDGYDSQICTFEIYVPPEFKSQFEDNSFGIRTYKEKRDVKNLGIELVELQKFKIEQFLKQKINEVKKGQGNKNFIRTKETAQRYFDYPPEDLADDEFNKSLLPFFYKDQDYQYRRVLFSGYEMYFLVTDIIIFTFFVLITSNIALSILLQYFCTKFFEWLKQEWQRDNISEKTKIDKRFLI